MGFKTRLNIGNIDTKKGLHLAAELLVTCVVVALNSRSRIQSREEMC